MADVYFQLRLLLLPALSSPQKCMRPLFISIAGLSLILPLLFPLFIINRPSTTLIIDRPGCLFLWQLKVRLLCLLQYA